MTMTSADRGPVLSGMLLGKQLEEARVQAGFKPAEVAKELSVIAQTVRRWETAQVTPRARDVKYLCELYGLPNEKLRDLQGLRARAEEPGWWNGSGKWPDITTELLGMEHAATRIRSWDHTAVPGLLQTPECARLIISAVDPNISPAQLDTQVELRMERQDKVFGGGGPIREATFIIDETALARMPGEAAIRRAQVARLLALPPSVTIQVVPFSAGPHPALGSFVIFDFDSKVIDAGVYVEGSVNTKAFARIGKEVGEYEQVYAWLQVKALTPQQTTEFLNAKLKGISDNEQ